VTLPPNDEMPVSPPNEANETNEAEGTNEAEQAPTPNEGDETGDASGQIEEEIEAPASPRRILKTLLFLVVVTCTLIAAAVFFFNPYSRLEKLAESVLSRHAPAGVSVGDISVRFPLSIVLKDVVVPVRTNVGRREINIEKVKGGVSVFSLLFGKLKADMNADLFGGKLWLDAGAGMSPGRDAAGSSLEFDARARGVDVGLMGELLSPGLVFSGRGDADIEGRMHGRDIASLTGQARARGDNIDLPQIVLDKITLPENHDVKFNTRLSARDKKIFIESLSLDGSAYDVSGDGVIRISEQFDRSPIDASFSVVFRKPPKISDMRLSGLNVALLLESLVKSEAEIFFTVSGEIKRPRVDVDTSSSLKSILESSSK
jgi:type II secretion system protein N